MSLWDFTKARVPRSEYQVVEKIGSGGTSEVFRGVMTIGTHSTVLRPAVAIKRLHAHLFKHEEIVQKFLQEAVVLASIAHPFAPSLIDLRQDDDDVWWMIQEFVNGKSMHAWLESYKVTDRTLDLSATISVVSDLCEVLAYTHKAGWVHCDVTLHNLLITSQGFVKLIDFGNARRINEPPRGEPHGTYAYMSPEHLQGKPVDARSDVFSIGIVLYELATGQRPFDGDHISIIRAICEREPVWPSQLQEIFPPALERIILSCLSKRPDDRPTISLLMDQIADFAASQALVLGPRAIRAAFTTEGATAVEQAWLQEAVEAPAPASTAVPEARPESRPESRGQRITRGLGAMWLPKSFRDRTKADTDDIDMTERIKK